MEKQPSMTSSQPAPRPPVSTQFKIGVAVAVVVIVVGVATVLKRSVAGREGEPLSAAESAALVERVADGATRLQHPELGFWLAHPGVRFAHSQEAEDKLRKQFGDASTRFYAFADAESGHMLYITVSKRTGLDADAFADMVDTVTQVFAQQTMARLGDEIPVETRTREFDPARGSGLVHKVLGGGRGHVRVGAWRSTFGRDHDYVVVVAGVSMRSDALADVIASFRVR